MTAPLSRPSQVALEGYRAMAEKFRKTDPGAAALWDALAAELEAFAETTDDDAQGALL